MFSQLSGLEGVGSMISSNDDLIPDAYGQVMSGSSSLAHTVSLGDRGAGARKRAE
jgi:hypothetical protein